MKPTKTSYQTSFFLPPTPQIREYSINFAGNRGSSADVDYFPLTTKDSPSKNQQNSPIKPQNLQHSDQNEVKIVQENKIPHQANQIEGQLNRVSANTSKYRELIQKSPLDRFIKADEFLGKELGKFPNVSDTDKHTKSEKKLHLSPGNLQLGFSKGSYNDLAIKTTLRSPKEPISAGKKKGLTPSPSQKLQKANPSPRKSPKIGTDQTYIPFKTMENYKKNSTPKMNVDQNQGSDQLNFFYRQEINKQSSPRIEWDQTNAQMIAAKVQEKAKITSPKTIDNDSNYLSYKSSDNNTKLVSAKTGNDQTSLSYRPNDYNYNNNAKISSPKIGWDSSYIPYNSTKIVSPRILETFPKPQEKHEKTTYISAKPNEFNNPILRTPSKDTFMKEPMTAPVKPRSISPRKESQNEDKQTPQTIEKTSKNTLKSSEYKLISPENKDKISLDFLFRSPSNTSSSFHLSSNQMNMKHTRSFANNLDNEPQKLVFFKKSFDVSASALSEKPKIDSPPFKSFTQFESPKINEDLKQKAFDIFKPYSPQTSKKTHNKIIRENQPVQMEEMKAEKKQEFVEKIEKLKLQPRTLESTDEFNTKDERTPLFSLESTKDSQNLAEKVNKNSKNSLTTIEDQKPREKSLEKPRFSELERNNEKKLHELEMDSEPYINDDKKDEENKIYVKNNQKQSFSSSFSEDKGSKSMNSITSIIMKRSNKQNSKKPEDNMEESPCIIEKIEEKPEIIQENLEKTSEKTGIEGKRRSVSWKTPKEQQVSAPNPPKKSIKTSNSTTLKPKTPQISEKKVSFTDNNESGTPKKLKKSHTTVIGGEEKSKSESSLPIQIMIKPPEETKLEIKILAPTLDSSDLSNKNTAHMNSSESEEDSAVLIPKTSQTTKNQDFLLKTSEKSFPKSPDGRAKSAQRGKSIEKDIKMDFLNLNEFVSTLGRGEVLPKRNSAKSPNDLHINLELLQKIAQEAVNDQNEKSEVRKKSKSSVMSMSTSIKKSIGMPEIQEKQKKDSKKSTESPKLYADEISSYSSSDYDSESDGSLNSSLKNEKKAGEKEKHQEKDKEQKKSNHLNVNMQESKKLSIVSSCESIGDDEDSDHNSQDIDFVYYMSNMRKFNRTNCRSNYFKELYCEHLLQSFKALNLCKLLGEVDEEQLAKKSVDLPINPEHKGRKTLIFDLDETLIHCNENVSMPCDVILEIKLGTGTIIQAGINVRPFAVEILRELSQHFEIIVFTASHSCYANRVIDYLDPQNEFIHHRLFRDNCVLTTDGAYVKDLRVFQNRKLEDLAIIDNACYSFVYQVENGVPIIPFYHNKNDEELKHLKNYLMQFKEKDIRKLNLETFKLHLYAESEDYKEILAKMFPETD